MKQLLNKNEEKTQQNERKNYTKNEKKNYKTRRLTAEVFMHGEVVVVVKEGRVSIQVSRPLLHAPKVGAPALSARVLFQALLFGPSVLKPHLGRVEFVVFLF